MRSAADRVGETEHGTAAVEHGAEHGEGAFNAGDTILHHILDSKTFEYPHFGGALPPGEHAELQILPFINKPLASLSHSLSEAIGFTIDLTITKHVLMMWLALGLLMLIFGLAKRGSGMVPRGLRNALEALIVYIRDEVARRAIHREDADRFVPFLLSLFFFILTCNLIGLVPGMATATGNISVTAGLAIVSFLIIQGAGVMKYGPVKHVTNLLPHGLPAWMIPLMFVLELLAQFIRPFALCIRLFANMMAGHVVILAFVCLIFILKAVWFAVAPVSVIFVFFVNLLELLVAFLQAYIFTMLTAQFIGMSLHPAH